MPEPRRLHHSRTPPHRGADDLQFRIADSFALLTDWNGALAGYCQIDTVLAQLMRKTGAQQVSLHRLRDERLLTLATAPQPQGEASVGGALARYLQATQSPALAPGTIWQLSTVRDDPGFTSSDAGRETRKCHEISVIVLETGQGHLDLIELSFVAPPDLHPDLPLALIGQALAEAWARRAPGIATAMIPGHKGSRRPHRDGTDILGSDNPCGLSRAEQRVCQLLLRGEKAKDIAAALNLRVATVRSHLGNIYAKSGTGGQVALIAMINRSKAPE